MKEKVWKAWVKCPNPECRFEGEWIFDYDAFEPGGLEASWDDPEFEREYEPECGYGCGAKPELVKVEEAWIKPEWS